MPGPRQPAAAELWRLVDVAEANGTPADVARVKALCRALLQPSTNLGSDAHTHTAVAAHLWEHGQSVLRRSDEGAAQPTLAALIHLQLKDSNKSKANSAAGDNDACPRHAAAQLCQQAWGLVLAGDQSDGIRHQPLADDAASSTAVRLLGMCLSLGRLWLSLDQLEQAEVCLSQGTAYQHTLQRHLQHSSAVGGAVQDTDTCLTLVFDVLLLRILVLWRLQQHALAQQLVDDCFALLQTHMRPAEAAANDEPLRPWLRVAMSAELLEMLLVMAACSFLELEKLDAAATGEFDCVGALLSKHTQTPASTAVARQPIQMSGNTSNGVTVAVLRVLELGYKALSHAEGYASQVRAAAGTGPDDEDASMHISSVHAFCALRVLRVRLLCWMAYCHYISGSPHKANNCMDSLANTPRSLPHQVEVEAEGGAQHGNDPSNAAISELLCMINHQAVTRLRLRVFFQCGRGQDAETELLALASDSTAHPATCLEEIEHIMQLSATTKHAAKAVGSDIAVKARDSGTKAAPVIGLPVHKLLESLNVLLQRSDAPQKAVITARFLLNAAQAGCDPVQVDMLLTSLLVPDHSTPSCNATALLEYFSTHLPPAPSAGAPQHGSISRQKAEKCSPEVDMKPADSSVGSKTAAQHVCQQLLQQQGMHHYDARNLLQAIQFLEASLLYAEGRPCLKHAVQLCKVLALACMAQGQMSRALSHLQHAEQMITTAIANPEGSAHQTQLASDDPDGAHAQDEDEDRDQDANSHHLGQPSSTAAVDATEAPRLPVSIPFLQLKIYLEQRNVEAALAQLSRLPDCDGYTPALMEVVCQEASRAKAYLVAAEALAGLHTRLVQGAAPASVIEADVMRCQIRCVELHFMQEGMLAGPQAAAPACEPDISHTIQGLNGPAALHVDGTAARSQAETTAVYMRLAGLFSTVHKRLDATGFSTFFGSQTADQAVVAGLEWFAGTGARLAAAAGVAGCAEAAAVMHYSVTSMLSVHPAPTTTTYRMRRMAAVLTTACVLTVACETPSKRAASCQLGRKMMNLCQELAPHCLAGPDGYDAQHARAHALLTYYELLCCLLMHEQGLLQQLLAGKLASLLPSQQPSGEQLVQLASVSKREGWPAATTRTLLQLALQRLAQQQPPNCDLIVKVLRAVVELTSSDAMRLATYKEAAQLLQQISSISQTNKPAQPATVDDAEADMEVVGVETHGAAEAPAPAVVDGGLHEDGGMLAVIDACDGHGKDTDGLACCFPVAEVEWLLATCWNLAAHYTRLLQFRSAVDFMQTALRLLAFTPKPYQKAHRNMMLQQLEQVEQQTR